MNFSSVGDLAQSLVLRRQSASLQSDLARLSEELATGKVSDVTDAVRGDFSALSSLERTLTLIEGYSSVRNAADFEYASAQNTLSSISDLIAGNGAELLSIVTLEPDLQSSPRLSDARDKFTDTVAKLNTNSGSRFLFSGVDTDQAPLADADAMLADIAAATALATTSTDLIQAVDDWFNLPGGGFETLGYLGDQAATQSTRIGPANSVEPLPTADSEMVRDLLKSLALSVLVVEGSFSGDAQAQQDIITEAGTGLVASEDALIETRSRIGFAQETIETVDQTLSVEEQNLEMARNKILAADPYETATELEAVQTQIETLYLITAKTSLLSLAEYLR
ncbi:MAG: flagellin [Pseudomonadota bacterium]